MGFNDYLKEISTRCEKATEGPWLEREDHDYYQGGTYLGRSPYYYGGEPYGRKDGLLNGKAEYFNTNVCRIESGCADKEFIAHARTDLPTLLRVIEKLMEQRNHWFNLYAASGSTNELDAELAAIVEGRDD